MTRLVIDSVSAALGGRTVLHGLSTELEPGELVGLVGPNGAGKTTLMRIATGLLAPNAGSVRLDDTLLERVGRRARARSVSYLPQGAPCHWPLQVSRLVALGRLPHLQPWQRPGAVDNDIVARAMAQADVTQLAERDALSLSGGERARVMLARALAGEPGLLLADEPVAGLDPAHQLTVMQALRQRSRDGMGVLVILHDLSLAVRFCDRLLLIHQGRLLADGSPTQVLSPKRLTAAFGIDALSGEHLGEPFLVPWKLQDGVTAVAD